MRTDSGLCVLALVEARDAEARQLAQALRLPVFHGVQPQGFLYALALTAQRVELQTLTKTPGMPGPIYADLCSADVRRRIAGGRRQPLARACGLHREGAQQLLDATAGLGRDGVVLAGLGCTVTLLERNAVLAALLRDGLRRAAQDAVIGVWLDSRINLKEQDALRYLQSQSTPEHDVVYLDPMYPPREKAALAKKEMRVLRAVAGDDDDASALLASALSHARKRVVVKRPPWGKPLTGREPDHQIKGNRARYDVYFTRQGVEPAAALSPDDSV